LAAARIPSASAEVLAVVAAGPEHAQVDVQAASEAVAADSEKNNNPCRSAGIILIQ
jgi:hypothetical protein